MKKILLMMLLFVSLGATAQVVVSNDSYTRKGKSFAEVEAVDSTGYTWTEKDGTVNRIFISKTGRCYIKKVSKNTGKVYRKYLPEAVSREICKELGVEYKEKDA